MKISLKEFKFAIDYRILAGGEDYYWERAVRDLKKIKEDEWTLSVEGLELDRKYREDALKDAFNQ